MVVAAALVSLALVAGATVVKGRGYTQPNVISDGWSSRWDATASTATMEVRLGNAGAQDITVIGADLLGPDGAPVPFAQVVSLTPITMAGLAPDATPAAIYVLPMTLKIDCPAALAWASPQRPVSLVLRTTGTVLHHDAFVTDMFDIAGFCTSE